MRHLRPNSTAITVVLSLLTSLGPLSPFFAEADVTKAINGMVRAQRGRTVLPGVRVFEKAVAAFRR